MKDFVCRVVLLMVVMLPLLQLSFIIMKLSELVAWSWGLVVLPSVVLALVVLGIGVVCYVLAKLTNDAFSIGDGE